MIPKLFRWVIVRHWEIIEVIRKYKYWLDFCHRGGCGLNIGIVVFIFECWLIKFKLLLSFFLFFLNQSFAFRCFVCQHVSCWNANPVFLSASEFWGLVVWIRVFMIIRLYMVFVHNIFKFQYRFLFFIMLLYFSFILSFYLIDHFLYFLDVNSHFFLIFNLLLFCCFQIFLLCHLLLLLLLRF